VLDAPLLHVSTHGGGAAICVHFALTFAHIDFTFLSTNKYPGFPKGGIRGVQFRSRCKALYQGGPASDILLSSSRAMIALRSRSSACSIAIAWPPARLVHDVLGLWRALMSPIDYFDMGPHYTSRLYVAAVGSSVIGGIRPFISSSQRGEHGGTFGLPRYNGASEMTFPCLGHVPSCAHDPQSADRNHHHHESPCSTEKIQLTMPTRAGLRNPNAGML